jgi:hypothetical protein
MGLLPHRRARVVAPVDAVVDAKQLVAAMKSDQVNAFLAQAKAYGDDLLASGRDHSRGNAARHSAHIAH